MGQGDPPVPLRVPPQEVHLEKKEIGDEHAQQQKRVFTNRSVEDGESVLERKLNQEQVRGATASQGFTVRFVPCLVSPVLDLFNARLHRIPRLHHKFRFMSRLVSSLPCLMYSMPSPRQQ